MFDPAVCDPLELPAPSGDVATCSRACTLTCRAAPRGGRRDPAGSMCTSARSSRFCVSRVWSRLRFSLGLSQGMRRCKIIYTRLDSFRFIWIRLDSFWARRLLLVSLGFRRGGGSRARGGRLEASSQRKLLLREQASSSLRCAMPRPFSSPQTEGTRKE